MHARSRNCHDFAGPHVQHHEVNEKAPDGAKRWIKSLMYVDGLCLFVGVDNARFAPVERHSDTGLCRSAKSEDGHGFGMRAA